MLCISDEREGPLRNREPQLRQRGRAGRQTASALRQRLQICAVVKTFSVNLSKPRNPRLGHARLKYAQALSESIQGPSGPG